jgi:hypothetical protein
MELALRVLHVGVTAAWFGHKLLIPRDLTTSLSTAERARDLLPRLARAERLGQMTGAGTLLTGLLLAWVVGFSTVAAPVWVGLGLVLVAIAIGAGIARPVSVRLVDAVSVDDLDGARAAGTRLGRVLGVESVLWAAALAAMLV